MFEDQIKLLVPRTAALLLISEVSLQKQSRIPRLWRTLVEGFSTKLKVDVSELQSKLETLKRNQSSDVNIDRKTIEQL